MDRGKVKYSVQDLYSLAWVFCLPFGMAGKSLHQQHHIGALLACWLMWRTWALGDSAGAVYCGVVSQPELRLNSECLSERTLYVLVPLKGELIPHHRFHIQLLCERAFQHCCRWSQQAALLPRPRLPRCSESSYTPNHKTATSVLERNYCIVDQQKTWAELSALTP